jgi:hypothetical protein
MEMQMRVVGDVRYSMIATVTMNGTSFDNEDLFDFDDDEKNEETNDAGDVDERSFMLLKCSLDSCM